MDALTNFLGALLRQYAVSPVLLTFVGVLFVYVMTRNYVRLRQEKLTPDLSEGERPLDEIEVNWVLMRTKTVLTNRRVIQLRLSWFLSKRKVLALALADLHSIVWRRRTNWICLLAGLYFVGTLNPLALLLVLYGLQGKIYSVIFDTPFAQMLWTRVPVRSLHREQLGDLVRFYRNAQVAWARTRAEKGLPAGSAPVSPVPEREADFLWGRPVWLYVVLLLVAGFLQRVLQPHVSFDDYVWAPIYLGLPVAVAFRSMRDGLWTAILGFVALFTIKFPSSGLVGLLVADGRSPYFEQYLLVLLTLLLMVLVASAIAKMIHPSLAFLAVLLWLGFVGLFEPNVFFDLGLYAKVAVAMAAAILLAWLERAIGHLYGASA